MGTPMGKYAMDDYATKEVKAESTTEITVNKTETSEENTEKAE